MNRKPGRKTADSVPKTQRLILNSKEALLASSSQLKQLLASKFEPIPKNKNNYTKSRLHMPALKTAAFDDQETTLETKLPIEAEKLAPLDINIPSRTHYLQRYSQKIVGPASLPKPKHPQQEG